MQATGMSAKILDWVTKFIGVVDVTLSALRQNPFQYQVLSGLLRRAKLRGFPYGLFYVVLDRQVTVVSCVHGRDPKIWQERT
jgi:hypothetical protein